MREKPIEYTPRWRTLEKGDHSSFMQFYCPKCDSDDIELYGANMRWNYKRQRWQIVSPKDAMFQCSNCDEQTSYEESTRKKHLGDSEPNDNIYAMRKNGGCFRCKATTDGFRDLCKRRTAIAELGGF